MKFTDVRFTKAEMSALYKLSKIVVFYDGKDFLSSNLIIKVVELISYAKNSDNVIIQSAVAEAFNVFTRDSLFVFSFFGLSEQEMESSNLKGKS